MKDFFWRRKHTLSTEITNGGNHDCIKENLKADSLFSNNANDIGSMHNFSLQ